ncbi:MAG: DUF3806 domain-containing protein [Pseudomonadota bacterium]
MTFLRTVRRAAFSKHTLLSLLLAFAVAPGSASAQLLEKRVTPLNPLDRQYMELQRELINELTLRYYGGRCCRSAAELLLLQRLLDDRHVSPQQTQELQAMGVLLGDLLAAEHDLQWVVYEDAAGRSRALQIEGTESYLFPVTMIARRWSVGDTTPVQDIYEQASMAAEEARPPLPFEAP